MSEDDMTDDFIDQAYASASAMLESDDGRARRRQAVIAAVGASATVRAPSRAAWRSGGWLAVAGIAAMSLVLALVSGVQTGSDRGRSGAGASVVARAPASDEREPRLSREQLPSRGGEATAHAEVAAGNKGKSARAEETPEGAGKTSAQEQRTGSKEDGKAWRDGESRRSHAAAASPEVAVPQGTAGADQDRPAAFPGEAQAVADAAAGRSPRHAGSALASRSATAEPDDLWGAIAGGAESRVGLLLDGGAALEGRDRDGDTPLLKAVKLARVGVADLLLRRGANPNAMGRDGRSSMDLAASSTVRGMKELFETCAEKVKTLPAGSACR